MSLLTAGVALFGASHTLGWDTGVMYSEQLKLSVLYQLIDLDAQPLQLVLMGCGDYPGSSRTNMSISF